MKLIHEVFSHLRSYFLLQFYNFNFRIIAPLQLEGFRCVFPPNSLVFFKLPPLCSFVGPPLSSVKFPHVCGSISELSILFCLYISLFLCRTVLFPSLWLCSASSYLVGQVPPLLLFFKIDLFVNLYFSMKVLECFLSSSNNPMEFSLRFH